MFKYILQVVICIFCSISIFGQTTVTIGTQSTETSAAAFVATPYNYYIESRRVQILYTAAEIIAAGGSAGTISSLAWDVSQVNGGNLLNYTINMANTASANLSAHDATGSTTVRNAATLTPGSTGWRTITFDTPFSWNGTSNLLIDVCWGVNSGWDGSGKIWLYDTGSSNVMRGIDNLSTTRCGVSTTATATGKPRIQLTITPALPTVTTSAVSSISTTTATGNGAISSIGGSAVTVSGVCWNTSTGPTTANSKTTDGPTSATTITSSITGLAAETYYYLKAYATNSSGTAYGAEVNFRTLSTEPTGHSATFTATLNGTSQIDLAFSAASGYGADGYILLRRTGTAVTSGGVSDATAPGSLSLTDATLVTTITSNATTSYSNTGLSGGQTYYYMLIPYNYDGSNNATYNYYIGGTIPTANATTPENYSTKGLVIAGNFTNNGTFVQTSDANYFAMSGSSKSLTGSGTYTNAKAYINGTITYDGTSTSDMTKTMINTAKTFTISNNKTYYNALMTINGTLVISATSSEIKNSGNWLNNGTFTANNSSLVTFTGSSGTTQTIGGTTTSNFYNATMNNSSGGVTLGIAATITNTLTLTSGKLFTAGYTLTLGTTSTNATVSGGSSSSYVVAYDNSGTIGYLKQFVNSNTAYTYPIGDANYYTPLTFTLTSNAGLSSAYYIVYTKPEKVPGLNSVFSTYLTRFWEGSSSGITTPVYSISYTYDNTDIVGTEDNLLPIKKSGTSWYKPTGSAFTTGIVQGTGSVNTGTNTLTWNGLSTFSYNGGAGDQATALPLNLISFKGEIQNNLNILKWNTASEINNDYFTIERTIDGINYEIIGTQNGAGNSNTSTDYELYDYNFDKVINYYRLKQTDFDGNSTLSNTISLDNREKGNISKSIVKITNILGQEISENYKGLVIVNYSDGSSIKEIR
jgi:hypothetical protein